MKRIGGARRKSRSKMRLSVSEKGKIPMKRYLQTFEEGEKVLLKPYPGEQKGLFSLRFYGKTGEIKGSQGKCYKVEIKDGGQLKTCVVNPVHLIRV